MNTSENDTFVLVFAVFNYLGNQKRNKTTSVFTKVLIIMLLKKYFN